MKNKRIIYIILVILCISLIFIFSSRNSSSSNGISKGLIRGGVLIYQSVTGSKVNTDKLVSFLNYPVRKMAHYSIYFLLGICVYKLVSISSFKHKRFISILICFLYASGDEIHQLFVVGRTGQVKDVLIDTLGSFTAIMIIYYIRRKKRLKTCIFNKNVL